MGRYIRAKQEIQTFLQEASWRDRLDTIAALGMTAVGPLFSCLLLDACTMHRSAVALGAVCARLAERELEKARNVVRRYMWHLSEESGNIGWGIPEAFAETLVASPILAKEFHRILVTYIIDLQKEDNYCDNDVLRRSCYWACGRFASERPDLTSNWSGWLAKGLEDGDAVCRGMAAWALSFFPLDLMTVPLVRRLSEDTTICQLFDGDKVYEKTVSEIVRETIARNA